MSQPAPTQSSQAALWAMVLGIAGVPISICAGQWGLAPLLIGGGAAVLGIVALRRIRRSQGTLKGRAMAWLGIVLGILLAITGVIIALLTVVTDFFVWIAQVL